jgi:hypothetical protein
MPRDPFEDFKKKKQEKDALKAAEAIADKQQKQLGWVEGLGPKGEPDPTKPKGFVKGRFKAKPVNPEEVAKLRPKSMQATRLTPPRDPETDEAAREDLPPEEVRKPKKFRKW